MLANFKGAGIVVWILLLVACVVFVIRFERQELAEPFEDDNAVPFGNTIAQLIAENAKKAVDSSTPEEESEDELAEVPGVNPDAVPEYVPPPDFLPPMDEEQNVSTRGCAVYFVPQSNVAACNDTAVDWYGVPMYALTDRLALINAKPVNQRTAAETTTSNIIQSVIRDRNAGLLPNGLCKMSVGDWVEPTKHTDGTLYPYKFGASSVDNRGDPSTWAFCFKEGTDAANAVHQAKDFVDGDVMKANVHATNGITNPFNDGKTYGKIMFDRLSPDALRTALCRVPARKLTQMPTDYMVLNVKATSGTSWRIDDALFQTMNPDQTFSNFPNAYDIQKTFFDLTLSRRKLQLVPKSSMTFTIYKLSFDVCGRVTSTRAYTQSTFSPSSLGLTSTTVHEVASSSDVTYGLPPDLTKRYADRVAEEANKTREKSQLKTSNAQPVYVPGLIYNIYKINQASVNYKPPGISNAQQMDQVFRDHLNFIYKAGWDWSLRYQDGSKRFGMEISGYLRLNSNYQTGWYSFKINTDDGADLFIDEKPVSTHYGYHGMDNRGTSSDVYMEQGKYYRFRFRVIQWDGPWGYNVQFRRRGDWRWSTVPSNIQFYDMNELHDTYNSKMKQLNTDLTRIGLEKVNLSRVTTNVRDFVRQHVESEFKKLRGSTIFVSTLQRMFGPDIVNQLSREANAYRLYIHLAPFPRGPANPEERQTLWAPEVNTCLQQVELPSPVEDLSQPVKYTLSMEVYIDGTNASWHSLFFHGKNNQDRTPGIWLHPKQTKLHIRHNSGKDSNNGSDPKEQMPMKQWFRITVVVNGEDREVAGQPAQSMYVYMNGTRISSKILTNDSWRWNERAGKVVQVIQTDYLNSNRMCTGNSEIKVRNISWFNRVLSDAEVKALRN
jgi:hypothetical protein